MKSSSTSSRSLVTPLPPPVRDASAWYGANLAKHTHWIERFSETKIDEVEEVVRKCEEIDFTSITHTYIPLPTLAPRLAIARKKAVAEEYPQITPITQIK